MWDVGKWLLRVLGGLAVILAIFLFGVKYSDTHPDLSPALVDLTAAIEKHNVTSSKQADNMDQMEKSLALQVKRLQQMNAIIVKVDSSIKLQNQLLNQVVRVSLDRISRDQEALRRLYEAFRATQKD